jgi:hypothetical protein
VLRTNLGVIWAEESSLQMEQARDADLSVDQFAERRGAGPFSEASEAVLLFKVSRLGEEPLAGTDA